MSSNNIHDEWLSLLEISGPFIAPPVLKEVFPQGLDLLDPGKRKRLRQTYEEWSEALDSEDPEFIQLHRAWIKEVISNCLGFDEDGKGAHLKFGSSIPEALTVKILEQGVTLAPEYVLVDGLHDNKPLLLIQSYSSNTDLQTAISIDGWSATPTDRMVQLCRLTGCRLGVLTNGERWMLVDAPVGAVTTFASWYARLWTQEPITLQAFVHLLGIRRFFVSESEQIPALIDRSLQHQDEVTTALGEQVQRAVEVLIQSLDRADQDRNRELLKDVTPAELYEAGLTVMMRLVFLLSAEERGLLLMGDECYEENYAISTLRMQLRSESEEILERRWDAWSRLLSVFRAVYGGINHENMRLPALGGSLFDPDRFSFLEGRTKGSSWYKEPAKPLPIDNRTVLLLLEAIQQYQGRSLSYRALDVEQIGYVYEGLLERTVKRTSEVMLDVGATRSAEKPLVSLAELESLRKSDESSLVDCLKERSGSSVVRIRNALSKPVDDQLSDRLLTTCLGNIDLRNKIKPYANLLKIDPWGYPLIYPANSFVVALGSDRRETGSHYTPKSLTEAIVTETLTPIVYVGPVEGLGRNEWVLKAPEDILQLKICDPAMGSGAFLVQICRFLSDRLIEAWELSEKGGATISSEGEVAKGAIFTELMPTDLESRIVIARRLIAERCLYGVDSNPLAVELAKLSIWLVTLSKGRPFGFLDHNLRHGDSLLGLHSLEQLLDLSMAPSNDAQQRLFGKNIRMAVNEAIELRKNLRLQPIRNINDVELMAKLDAEAREKLNLPNIIANAFIGLVFKAAGNNAAIESGVTEINISAAKAIEGDSIQIKHLVEIAKNGLGTDLSFGRDLRRPFHWPLEFPEVFNRELAGFDAIVGNPPFLGGQRITGVLGTAYRDWLVQYLANEKKGSADLVAYFFLRVYELIRVGGGFGMLAVNTIAEGDTRQVGLESMISSGAIIYAAYPNEPWPGKASVVTSRVHIHKGEWRSNRVLLGRSVKYISAFLSDRNEWTPKNLSSNDRKVYQGSIVLGMGFVISQEQAIQMIDSDSKNSDVIFPYINGEDLNSDPEQKPSRWVINFWDWPQERAQLYPMPWKWVEENVKSERLQNKDKGAREKWWLFLRPRSELYHLIGRGQLFEKHPSGWSKDDNHSGRVIIFATQASKYAGFSFAPTSMVYSNAIGILADDSFSKFAELASSLHVIWAYTFGGRMKTDLRYSPSDCFVTYPFLNSDIPELSLLGERLSVLRRDVMMSRNLGMTKLYNLIHNPNKIDSELSSLRELHCKIDKAVLNAYEWNDIILDHGYHKVAYLPDNDNIRFTISESARIELLGRLLELNRQRYDEEVQQEVSSKTVRSPLMRSKRAGDLGDGASKQAQLEL